MTEPLHVICSVTSRVIQTDIPTDPKSLVGRWDEQIEIPCMHCGQTHRFVLREAYVAAEVSDYALRGAGEQSANARRRNRPVSRTMFQ